jgi:hypothetical protein
METLVQLFDGLHTQNEYSSTMSNLTEYGCQRECVEAKKVRTSWWHPERVVKRHRVIL